MEGWKAEDRPEGIGSSRLVLGFVDRGTTHGRVRETAGTSSWTRVTAGWRHAGRVLWKFLAQANGLQHVGPFSALPSVAVFEMLSEVIGSVKLFGMIAFGKFVDIGKVVHPAIPVRLREVWEFLSTETADVGLSDCMA